MPAIPRQKACIPCADSKRRCDKQFPECHRCLDRDVDCVYPQPKRRRRDPVAPEIQAQGLPDLQNYVNADALGSSLDFGDWAALGNADLDITLSDFTSPYMPAPLSPLTSLSTQGAVLESDIASSTPCLGFLQQETWIMRHCNEELACVTDIELEPFIRTVDEMLQSWVRNGHNSFIHRRLYEKGMPKCLQDAFTTLAAYTTRSPPVKETILQIAEERSAALVHQDPPAAPGAQGIRIQLAHVQALFIYEFIRLFDGSVPSRASAEQQLPTLRRWVTQMWEIVKRYQGEDSALNHAALQRTASEFDREYEATSEMWRLWILTESVRRSQILINTVANVYETMNKGLADCSGAVMFTARRGLWEVESAVKWYELYCAKSPLLVPSLQPGPLISQYPAEEIDDFAKMFWTFLVGTDKIQYWNDRSNKMS